MQRRVVAAFALAPLACPVAYCLLGILIADPQSQSQGTAPSGSVGAWFLNVSGWLLIVSLYALPIAYLTELVLGFPAWMVFRRYGVRSLAAYAAGGAVIGWLEDLAATALVGRPLATALNPFSMEWLRFDFSYVASASACAALFRVIVFSGRAPIKQD